MMYGTFKNKEQECATLLAVTLKDTAKAFLAFENADQESLVRIFEGGASLRNIL